MGSAGILKRLKAAAAALFERIEYVLPSDSKPLNTAEYARACGVCDWAANQVSGRDNYIARHGLDVSINNPAANWDASKEHFSGYRAIASKDRKILNNLRLFTQAFSGHYMGLAIAQGLPFPRSVPQDFDVQISTILDEISAGNTVWWTERRDKLIAEFPELGAMSLPIAFGESGFREEGKVLNHDTFTYLERLGLMKASGVLDDLNNGRRVVVLEIGSGFGALAHMMRNAVPNLTYICLDLPESLCFAALYLSRFNSNICLVDEATDLSGLAKYDYVFLPNYMFHRLIEVGVRVDLAINTLSMSEMTQEQVQKYCEGISLLIGNTGAFFEQNQNNKSVGLCFAKEIAAEVFSDGRPLQLPMMDLTQGSATLWQN